MSRVRTWSIVAVASLALVVGCNAILGNEEGTLAASDAGSNPDASVDAGPTDAPSDAIVADVIPDAALSCPIGKKLCEKARACVDPTDPNYGCADPSCNQCDNTNAQAVACVGINGIPTCKATCNAGFKDCDGKPGTGCETDLSSPTSCGDCNVKCSGTASLCSKSGNSFACVGSCPPGQTQCGQQCVDTEVDPAHCGNCTTACAAPANATATCTAHTCGYKCDALYHACSGHCVSDSEPTACGASCLNCVTAAPANTVPSCQLGQCQYECAPGFGNCNGDMKDGCEVDLYTNDLNCGKCGFQCGGAVSCTTCITPVYSTYCCNGACISSSQLCAAVR